MGAEFQANRRPTHIRHSWRLLFLWSSVSTEHKSRRVSSVFFPACPRLTTTQQQLPQPGCGLVNNRSCCGLGIQHQKQRRSCLGFVMLMLCHYTLITSGVHNLLLFHKHNLVLLWNDRWPAFLVLQGNFHKGQNLSAGILRSQGKDQITGMQHLWLESQFQRNRETSVDSVVKQTTTFYWTARPFLT